MTVFTLQVHQVLGELYGHLVTTKTYTSEGQPRWKKVKRAASRQGPNTEEEEEGRSFNGVPCIVVRFRPKAYSDGAREKGGAGDGDLFTRFVLRKENIVRWRKMLHGGCLMYIHVAACSNGSAEFNCTHATFT